MATLSLVIASSHSPFMYRAPEQWNEIRERRTLRADVPYDSIDQSAAKLKRCADEMEVLREKVERVQPDVLVMICDEEPELLYPNTMPPFVIYAGPEFEGYNIPSRGVRVAAVPRTPQNWAKVQGHPALGRELTMGLMLRDFDVAFSLEAPKSEMSMGVMRPLHSLTPDFGIPVVPIFVNCRFPPQPRGVRCFDLGRALREVIEESPLALKVVVLGSGGLWHTPSAPNAYLDEEFDKRLLAGLAEGDGRGTAEWFDAQARPGEVGDGGDARGMSRPTGMQGGVGEGAGEMRNWLTAAGAADGMHAVVVDYVPVYASPCGMGFAYWE